MKSSRVLRFLSSLKLAIVMILGITFALATATILESLYDTPTAQYWVYRSVWFHALLFIFAINIFTVAMSRLPWKRSHIPFLLAHLGILTLLAGSWVTERYGIDGSMRIAEGESASAIEFENASLILSQQDAVHGFVVPWMPPNATFKPVKVRADGVPFKILVDQFLSHAEPVVSFYADPKYAEASGNDLQSRKPAIQLNLAGGPMGISQDFWLWEGDPSWSAIQAGPAMLALGVEPPFQEGRPQLTLLPEKDGGVTYRAISAEGKKVSGHVKAGMIGGTVIQPGWKNVTITLKQWIPAALVSTTYKPAHQQYGKEAPPSAIHLVATPEGASSAPGSDIKTEIWLGLGDRATLHWGGLSDGREVGIAYLPRQGILPFSVRLDRFTVERYEGSNDPASYSSNVTVLDGGAEKPALIAMNEPLTAKGYTLYQASYEDGQPRPVVSILSINRDPGRIWKYIGSFLIVFGSILLFAAKYSFGRRSKKVLPGKV